ncbi:MAG: type VII secretion protein EssB [Sporolactobacillus sp.]
MALTQSFFQTAFDAEVEESDGQYLLTFQRVKIPLRADAELGALSSMADGMTRTIQTTEDEVTIQIEPAPDLKPFEDLKAETEIEKLIFASNLVHFFEHYPQSRLVPVCFPENLFVSPGFAPVFLHYGVKGSLPPLESAEGEALKHVKAVIASLLDPSETFDTYAKFDFVAKTTSFIKKIFNCKDFQTLARLIAKRRQNEVTAEKQSIRVPRKKNFIRKVLFICSLVLLAPLIAVTIYAYVIQLPREDLFENAHENFLGNQYSNVVTTLSPISFNRMPRVVQYELAVSFVENQNLNETQKTNILKDVTLQSNPLYYQYWIQTGRGDAAGALNTARSLNDRMLIAYALLNEQSAIQNNLKMNGAQKQARLQRIDGQLKQYRDLLKQQKTAPASGTNGESTTTDTGTSGQSVESSDASSSSTPNGQSGGTSPKKSDKSQKKGGSDQSSGK